MGKNDIIDKEKNRIDEAVRALDEKKIDMLREVPFKKWNDLTNSLDIISRNILVLTRLQGEMSVLNKVYGNDEEKIRLRRQELNQAIDEVKKRMMPFISIRNEILSDYPNEFGMELQRIYVQIADLEMKKDNFKLIRNISKNVKQDMR